MAARIKAPPQNSLVTACLEALRMLHVPAWRNNTGAARYGGRRVKYGERGAPDILGIIPGSGRLLCVECKSGGGRLSADQRAWLGRAAGAGAMVFVARSAAELVAALGASLGASLPELLLLGHQALAAGRE